MRVKQIRKGMEHLCLNQYNVKKLGSASSLYDIECVLLYVDLAKFCAKEFGCGITPSEKVCTVADKVRGRKEYGNTAYVRDFQVRVLRNGYEVVEHYTFKGFAKVCTALRGNEFKTKDELLALLNELHDYIESNDIMTISYMKLMTKYDMKYICNRLAVAERIVDWYKDVVTNDVVAEGMNAYLNIGKN